MAQAGSRIDAEISQRLSSRPEVGADSSHRMLPHQNRPPPRLVPVLWTSSAVGKSKADFPEWCLEVDPRFWLLSLGGVWSPTSSLRPPFSRQHGKGPDTFHSCMLLSCCGCDSRVEHGVKPGGWNCQHAQLFLNPRRHYSRMQGRTHYRGCHGFRGESSPPRM